MKKSLFISILALLFSVAALVKVFYPCKKAAEAEAPAAVAAVNVEEILNEKPEIIFNAMQKYQQKMQEEAMAAAKQLIKDNVEEINNDPNSPFVGNKDAEIVLVEFYDYACGFCHRLFPELNEVMANNKDIKVVFKPLAFVSQYSDYAARAALAAAEQGIVHFYEFAQYSDYAARAALAAAEQGKFVEMHNALFTVEGPLDEDKINEVAGKIGLDVEKLKADAKGEKIDGIMNANNTLAGNIQVNGVPTLILNGELLQTIDGGVIQDSIDELKK